MEIVAPQRSATAAPRRIRVLGVDPAATGPTGYGIVDSEGSRCRAIHYGVLRVAGKQRENAGAALEAVHTCICDLIREYSPDFLAVESIFSALNVRTALRLAEVRGVVLLAAAQHGIGVHSYAPREIKASIAGYGHADKRQMQIMVKALLSLVEIPEPADAADALAVALCHLQSQYTASRFHLQTPPRASKTRNTGLNDISTGVNATKRGAARLLGSATSRLADPR